MSYPYPQDRTRDKQTKGDEPYKDAREDYAESEAQIKANAAKPLEPNDELTEEERNALQEQQAEERFREIGDEVDES